MEWWIGLPIILLLLVCPLMMLGMIVGGWLLGRRATGGQGHAGHGMMMCMGHGQHGSDGPNEQTREPATNKPANQQTSKPSLVEELKEERRRVESLERQLSQGRPDGGPTG